MLDVDLGDPMSVPFPLPPSTPPPSLVYQKRVRLVIFLVWGVVAGALAGVATEFWGSFIGLIDLVLSAVLIIQWAYLDADEHDFELTPYFVPLMIICPGMLIVMPIYFIKSRGCLRGLLASIVCLVFLVIAGTLTTGCAYMTYSVLHRVQ